MAIKKIVLGFVKSKTAILLKFRWFKTIVSVNQ